jgi:hypothetical protein
MMKKALDIPVKWVYNIVTVKEHKRKLRTERF